MKIALRVQDLQLFGVNNTQNERTNLSKQNLDGGCCTIEKVIQFGNKHNIHKNNVLL